MNTWISGWRVLLIIFILFLFAIVASVTRLSSRSHLFDRQMAALEEPNTKDCSIDNDYEKSLACAVKGVKKGKPVKFTYRPLRRSFGVITTSDGHFYSIQYYCRLRWGLTDWEMIEVYRGNIEIRTSKGREVIWSKKDQKVFSSQIYWPILGRSAEIFKE